MHNWLTIELVLGILLVTSFTSVGLLALWAATSPRHWFIRTAIVLAALSPILLVPAYEPFLVYVMQAAVVAIGVTISRWWQTRRNSSQSLAIRFSLGSFLLVTVLMAIAVVIATKLPKLNVNAWSTMVFAGVSAGLATLIGGWMFVANRKLVAWPVGLAICLLLGAILAWTDWFVPSIVSLVGWPPNTDGGLAMSDSTFGSTTSWFFFKSLTLSWLVVQPHLALLIAILLPRWEAAFGSQEKPNDEAPSPRRTTKLRLLSRGFVVVLLALIACFPLAVLGKLLTPDLLPDTTLPNPNGYDDLIVAGRIAATLPLSGRGGFDYTTAAQPALAAEVAKCDAVYEKVALGLSRSCRVPVDYSFSAGSLPMDHLMSLRGIARTLAGKARLAQLEGHPEDAAKTYLDLVRFGHAIRRGGLLIDGMVGVACTGIGLGGFNGVHNGLSPTAATHCVAELLEIDSNEEPYDDLWQRDRVWTQRAGWHSHFQQLLEDLTLSQQMVPFLFLKPREYENVFVVPKAITRLMICDMALARFHEPTGKWPESLTELIPVYLPVLPIDPLDPDERSLRYRRDGDSYFLYSIGLNAVDDNGAAPDADDNQRFPQTGDLRLDLYFAPEPDPTNAPVTQNSEDSAKTQAPATSQEETVR